MAWKRILEIAGFFGVGFLVLVGVAYLATMGPADAADGFIEQLYPAGISRLCCLKS